MADKVEDLFKNAVQGKPYGNGSNVGKDSIKIDKPMTLKHSLDSSLGKSLICNERTEFNNKNNN